MRKGTKLPWLFISPRRRLVSSVGHRMNAERQYKTYGHYVKQAERLMERELVSYGKYEELLLDAFRADLVYGDDEEAGDVID